MTNLGSLPCFAAAEQRRQLRFVGLVAGSTTVLLSFFFFHVFFAIEGAAAFCRQRYDAPFLSFYSDYLNCFVSLRDLMLKFGHILVSIASPMLLSFAAVAVCFRRLCSHPSGAYEPPTSHRRNANMAPTSEASLVFWTFTLSVLFSLGIVLVLHAVGLKRGSPEGAAGSILFYALHLYVVGFLVVGIACLLRKALRAVG